MERSLIPQGRLGFRSHGLTSQERAAVLDELFYEGDRRKPYLGHFFTLMVISTGVAALGLAAGSAAVVIGAMLIAPLMTPIMAFAAATIQAWPKRQLESLAIVASGAVVAIAISWLVAVALPSVHPDTILPGEIIARSRPSLFDLGIALLAGGAGAYVTVRSEASSALPGVGISVALVPPLATVGITLGIGRSDLAGGAGLLFLTNFAAITLAGGLVFAIAGFVPPREHLAERRLSVGLALFLVVVLAVPLSVNSRDRWRDSQYQAIATDQVAGWDPTVEIRSISVDPTKTPVAFDLVLAGSGAPGDPDALAAGIADEIGEPTTVEIVFEPTIVGAADP